MAKLNVEMVPAPILRDNLRSPDRLGRSRWRKLRAKLIEERGPNCSICGSGDHPEGHEIWEYEEKPRLSIAYLRGIEIICRDCHKVHHWGRTRMLVLEGEITRPELQRLIDHACRVNKWTPLGFKRHVKQADRSWDRRSELSWKINWGQFKEAINDAKAARVEWAIMMENAGRNPRKPSQPRAPAEPEKTWEQRMFDGDGPLAWKRKSRRRALPA